MIKYLEIKHLIDNRRSFKNTINMIKKRKKDNKWKRGDFNRIIIWKRIKWIVLRLKYATEFDNPNDWFNSRLFMEKKKKRGVINRETVK